MALEVGRLVARIDIEGSFEQKLTAAKSAMEDAAKSAGRFDDAMSKAGQSGAKLKVSDEPKRKIDDAAKSATKLDDGLSKASEAGKRLDVSNDARRKLDDTATSAGKTATALDKASASGKNMQVSDQPRQKLAETASMAEQVNTKFSGLGITMKQVVGMAGGAAGLGAVLTKGWDRVTAIDTAQGKLRGLGHEAEGVATIMDSALESVKGTSYGLGDAATIAANAVAAGIQPGKDLTKYLTMTADASAIAGVSLGEMGRILNQVQTGQAAYAGDLSQLADRGIPIYQWLADEAGVAASEVKKMASTGQISSEMLFSAIQNNIGGAAKEVGSTLTGALANAGAAFGRLGAAAITPFKETILDAASGVTDFADTLSSGLGPVASVAATALSGVAKAVGTIPTPILAATAALVTLQKTGLGAAMAGAASTAVGALKGVGETMILGAGYARDNIKANGLFAASMDGIKGAAGGLRAGLGNIVNMLGGPWMIGLAGATVAVTEIIAVTKRASEAQAAISESAGRAASAHRDLAFAVGEANGAMSDQAVAAAQSIIEESITSTAAAAEQASGIYANVNNWVNENIIGYEGMTKALEGNMAAVDRSVMSGRVNEMQMAALSEAAADLGIRMDEVAEIAQRGGPRWTELKDRMAEVGPEGEDMANKMQAAADAANATAEAARRATPGSMELAEAFRLMSDEAASAQEQANALRSALDTLSGSNMDAEKATAEYYATVAEMREEMAGLVDQTDGWGESLLRTDGRLNTQTETGRNLLGVFDELIDANVNMATAGESLADVTAHNESVFQSMAAATGLPIEKIRELAREYGLIPEVIESAIALRGADTATAEISALYTMLKNSPEGEVIVRADDIEHSRDELTKLDLQLKDLGDGNVRITSNSDEVLENLGKVAEKSAAVGEFVPKVHLDSNAGDVGNALMDLLPKMDQVDQKTATPTITADTAAANSRIGEIFRELEVLDQQEPTPGVDLIIDKFMQGRDISHQELDELHARVVDPKARLLIEELLRESARANLDLDNTARPRTATITPVLAAGSLGSIQSALNSMSFSVPVRGTLDSFGRADGGIDGVRSFADGGMLPSRAVIERPRGVAGMVQWAEAETGGEAFIPLAPSKRKRSRQIWAKTGELLGVNLGNLGEIASFADGGMLPDGDGKRGDMGGVLVPLFGKFADGGITASGLVNFAKGVEGAPYVWGGVNWGDCSGAVSAIANYVSGRSPFGSRFATGNEGQALAERGFVPGLGSAGDLQIGWFNGGPYGGHTSATLPNGVNFEMGGGRGNGQYGGSAAGANHSQYTNHAHWPKEKFADAGETLGGAAVDNRTQRQKNIDAIVAEGQRRGLSDRDIQIALMTAEQESGIRVLNNPADPASMNMAAEGTGYDGTSTGIFQQQNNGAWGTLEDRMDPTKSAGMFYDELEKIEGRDNMRLTEVAQRVQGSAHPEAYAKWEGKASEELAASKARLESLSKTGGGSGDGQRVFVTNWPSGGGSYTRSSSSDAIEDAKDAVEDAQKAAFIQDQSIAALAANALGRGDLIQVEKFADGGFHGLENHRAHIAPAGSWRVFGEPETGGEAYIPLASHKRARSTAILAETARRFGYTLGAGVNLVGSVLTGNGLDTGWGGPSLSDLGIDTGALRESLSPGVQAEAERAGMQIAAILQELGAAVDQQVEGTLARVDDGTAHLRQQYARAMI